MSAAAKFDGATAHRRSLIGKVHVAKSQLGLDDDTYRQILFDVSGRTSAADCSESHLVAVLKHFEARGFKPKIAASTGGRRAGKTASRAADHPSARKTRALWISLHHLCAIDNPSEKALEAFARRQLKVEQLQWADQALCYKLVEALKAIAERHGWSQGFSGVQAKWDSAAKVRALKIRLCEAILAKLNAQGLAAADWSLTTAAFRLCGIEAGAHDIFSMSVEDLDLCARSLGAKLRAAL